MRSTRTVEEGRRRVTTPEVSFTGNSGVTKQPEDLSPLGFFNLMNENIVQEKNRYAAEYLRGKALTPKSRFKKWVDVTVQEMWTFFGIITAMGLVVIDDILPLDHEERQSFVNSVLLASGRKQRTAPKREQKLRPYFQNTKICHQAAGEL
ncbi:PiggyBac transposable element-derived protein 4 [Plakobranchus ocellatus]|uniref:PiggyBac transposable element-derived protein 4 n=1 Tax=Plakobranchus ocellatus TaxID=259542 RepID=A0AAV4A7G3_9GAST|nr:PiggyBac transposable element-derived protein 4 [Plakobranchus ocellatus]